MEAKHALILLKTAIWTVLRLFFTLWLAHGIYLYFIYASDLIESESAGIISELMAAIYIGFAVMVALTFALFRSTIENSNFFGKPSRKKIRPFVRPFNFSGWNEVRDIYLLTSKTQKPRPRGSHRTSFAFGKKQGAKHTASKNEKKQSNFLNFMEWLLPSNVGLDNLKLSKARSSAFIIFLCLCRAEIEDNTFNEAESFNKILELIAQHNTLFRQTNIDSRVIRFARNKLMEADSVSYYLEAAARDSVQRFHQNKTKPSLKAIFENDIIRWPLN